MKPGGLNALAADLKKELTGAIPTVPIKEEDLKEAEDKPSTPDRKDGPLFPMSTPPPVSVTDSKHKRQSRLLYDFLFSCIIRSQQFRISCVKITFVTRKGRTSA